MEKMVKRLLSIVMVIFMVLSMVPGTAFAAENCAHSIVLYSEAVEGSCITPPKQALYVCEHCSTLFVDAEGTQKAEGESMVFPDGHDLVFVPAKAATNTQPGNLAHYLCLVCQGTYETEDSFAAEEYDAEIPVPPTASVKAIDNDDLTFAMNFKADTVTDKQLEIYGDWYADFELTLNKDVTFFTGEGADGYLAGQYDEWSSNWVKVPYNKSVTVKAGETIRIMEFASELMGKTGLKYTFREVYDSVKDFDCGLFFNTEFLMENPDLKVTLNLRMYNNEDETQTYSIGETYEFTLPQVPTATVTEIENDDLTFAMNFKADDVTDEQLDFYGDWYADFELTLNKDVTFFTGEGADGYLAGQYDEWSSNWVKVPYNKSVTVKAGETIRIMEFASELMGKTGLKYTFREVYDAVKDFDCGVFFNTEFLMENPDLKVTLELRMYQTDDEEEQGVVIGETYEFTLPQVPTATVTEIENDDLTFAMNFKADAVTDEQLDFYGDWYADYVLTINKDAVFNADGSADGYLSGHYASYSENWINVPFENVVAKANEPVRIMKLAAEMLNKPELLLTYNDVAKLVKDFDCGVFFDAEYLAANPDLKVTLELRMYQTDDEEEQGVVIGETYVFEAPSVAKIGDVEYKTLAAAVEAANDGDTIVVINDLAVISTVIVDKNVTIDLNGKTVSAALVNTPAFRILGDVTVTGGTVDASNGSGCYAFIVGSNEAAGTLNIADGAYKGNVSAVSVTKGVANISGGTFSVSDSQWGATYLLNCIDDNVMNGTAKFVVTGGAFVGFNPKVNAAENPVVSFCAPGYKGVDDGTGTYIVEQSADVVAWNMQTGVEYETVADALAAATAGQTVQVLLECTETVVFVYPGVTLDLNGYKLTATYVAADFANANIIDSSVENTGLLVVAETNANFAITNAQLPIKTPGGYRFADATVRLKVTERTDGLRVTTGLMADSDLMIAQLINEHSLQGVQLQFRIKLDWTGSKNDEITQYFRYQESTHTLAVSNWLSNAKGYDAGGLGMTVTGAEGLTDLTFVGQLVLLDATGREMVVFESEPISAPTVA